MPSAFDPSLVAQHYPYNPTLDGSPPARATVWQTKFADVHREWPVEETMHALHEQVGYTVATALPGTEFYSYCCSEVLLVRTDEASTCR